MPTNLRFLPVPIVCVVVAGFCGARTEGQQLPPKSLELNLGGGVKMKFVRIDPGKFMMGTPAGDDQRDDDEGPQHEVEITKPFYMGVHEVTRGQFRAFVAGSGYRTDAESDGKGGGYYDEQQRKFFVGGEGYNWRNTGFLQTDDHPVVNVTWNDAVAFCGWLSRTSKKEAGLPTEAQWEYACRAGTTTRFHGGDADIDLKPLGNIADLNLRQHWNYRGNFRDDAAGRKFEQEITAWFNRVSWYDGYTFTGPVGQYEANSWGLYDMHGNVWEWCQDWYAADYYRKSPKQDPSGPDSGTRRVGRGGSFDYHPRLCRSAGRGYGEPDGRVSGVGFRVVLLLP